MESDTQSTRMARLKKLCRNYFREAMEISIRSVLLLISTAVLSLIVLYFYGILWHIYGLTHSGKKFIMLQPEAANRISNIVNNDLIEISIHTTFSAFTICLIICAICRVTYIKRFFYYPRNTIGKLLFWGLPLTAIVSMYVNDQIQWAHWSYTVPITIVPTLCVFTYCFQFSEALLPEIGDIVGIIFNGVKRFFSTTTPQER